MVTGKRRRITCVLMIGVVAVAASCGSNSTSSSATPNNGGTQPPSARADIVGDTPDVTRLVSEAHEGPSSTSPHLSGPGSGNPIWKADLAIGNNTDTTLWLIRSSHDKDNEVCKGHSVPDAVPSNAESYACVEPATLASLDAVIDVTYRIGDSGYSLVGHAKVPAVGSNEVSCSIHRGDSNIEDSRSPYRCRVAWGSYDKLDPKPRIVIDMKQTTEVTDLAKAAQILDDNCNDLQPQCRWKATKQTVMAAPREKWQLWGAAHANCLSQKGEQHTVSEAHTISWSDNFSIKAGVKFDIAVVKATVDATYSHSVTASTQFNESHTQTVPYGRVGAYFLQPGFLEIVGDFTVSTNDTTYVIKNFTFDLPLSTEVRSINGERIQPVTLKSVDLGDAQCDRNGVPGASTPAPKSPPPENTVDLPIID